MLHHGGKKALGKYNGGMTRGIPNHSSCIRSHWQGSSNVVTAAGAYKGEAGNR